VEWVEEWVAEEAWAAAVEWAAAVVVEWAEAWAAEAWAEVEARVWEWVQAYQAANRLRPILPTRECFNKQARL